MLADDKLLVGSDVDKTLRSDGAEATTARVTIVDGDNGQMVVDTGAYAIVGTHGPGIDLGGELFPLGNEILLFLGSGLDDCGKFLFLRLKILAPHGDVVLKTFLLLFLRHDGGTGVVDSLLGDLTKKSLILNLFIDGVVLAAVGDVVELLLVLLDLEVAVNNVLLVLRDSLVVSVDNGGALRETGFEIRYLILKSLDF